MKKNTFSTLLLAIVLVALCVAGPAFALTRHSQQTQRSAPSKTRNHAVQAAQKIAGSVPVNLRGVFVDGLPNILGQMVAAGDNVDVVLTFEAILKSGNKEKISITLLQNVRLI